MLKDEPENEEVLFNTVVGALRCLYWPATASVALLGKGVQPPPPVATPPSDGSSAGENDGEDGAAAEENEGEKENEEEQQEEAGEQDGVADVEKLVLRYVATSHIDPATIESRCLWEGEGVSW